MNDSTNKSRWTAAHQREALRRTYEIAALMVAHGDEETTPGAHQAEAMGGYPTRTEVKFREGLATWAAFDRKRINREVGRVRGLAEGRLVRETVWRVYFSDGSIHIKTEEQAKAERASGRVLGRDVRISRTTRIRRATP